MRILGIDYGARHVGVAMSDTLGIVAQGLPTIHYSGSMDRLIGKVKELVKRHEVTELVVGLPLNMNGTRGEKAREAEHFAKCLKEETALPTHLWDERLTTAAAARDLSEWKVGIQKKKMLIDRIAAQCILQGYLDFQRSQNS